MNYYEQFVSGLAELVKAAESYPLGGVVPVTTVRVAEDAPKVLIFSPHPDDEVIIGALPLRLLRESGFRVVNVAVTLGSRQDRRQERLFELKNACAYLNFELVETADGGLEKISPKTRDDDPALWQQSVSRVAEILAAHQPLAIFFPHEADGNKSHIGTHFLVGDALQRMDASFSCYAVETEFWHPMRGANLLVESSIVEVVDLVTALSYHVGEVKRNPYHLRLPAWMMDNVRRGGEMVGGQGAAPPAFTYGTIYKLSRWENSRFAAVPGGGKFVNSGDDLSGLFSRPKQDSEEPN